MINNVIHHEGPHLHRVRVFNLSPKSPRVPNHFWILVNGNPVETWKTIGNAHFYYEERIKFLRKHNVHFEVTLCRFTPNEGFEILFSEES